MSKAKAPNPFRYFNSSPEVIRLVVMMYVKYPLSLRNVHYLWRAVDHEGEVLESYVTATRDESQSRFSATPQIPTGSEILVWALRPIVPPE